MAGLAFQQEMGLLGAAKWITHSHQYLCLPVGLLSCHNKCQFSKLKIQKMGLGIYHIMRITEFNLIPINHCYQLQSFKVWNFHLSLQVIQISRNCSARNPIHINHTQFLSNSIAQCTCSLLPSCCVAWCNCCWFFFLTNCSADLISSKVTPWVDLLVSLTRFAWAFLCVSDSSSLTGGTNDLHQNTTVNNSLLHHQDSSFLGHDTR
jgi:hypothetical protein